MSDLSPMIPAGGVPYHCNRAAVHPARWRSPPLISLNSEIATVASRLDAHTLSSLGGVRLENSAHALASQVVGLTSHAELKPGWISGANLQGQLTSAINPTPGTTSRMPGVVAIFPPSASDVHSSAATTLDMRRTTQVPLSNVMSEVVDVYGWKPTSTAAGSQPRVGVLWEIVETLRDLQAQVRDWARTGRDTLTDLLATVQRDLEAALLPPPEPAYEAFRPAYRGAVRTSGRRHERGDHVRAVELGKGWTESRTFSLRALTPAVLRRGRLTLAVGVDDTSLDGRVADLVLMTKGAELAVARSRIGPWPRAAKVIKLKFDVDLAEAGLQLRDAAVPLEMFQVVVEPREDTI